jgi:hypothetical protein
MAEQKTSYADIKIPVAGYFVECRMCHRKILVECGINGTNHNIAVLATCWDCMKEEHKKEAIKLYGAEIWQN